MLTRLHQLIRENIFILLLILIFCILSIPLISFSSVILNPDGLEYIVIAKHYIAGDSHAAINGIWSPLLSWIFIVPLTINVDPFLFFRLLMVPLSVAVIITFHYSLLHILGSEQRDKTLYYAGIVSMFLFCIYASFFTPITPDFFSVLFLLLLVNGMLRYSQKASVFHACVIGVTAGIGYYGKNYFFYFALASIVFFYIHALIIDKNKANGIMKKLTHFGISIGIPILLITPWISLMSMKYERFTLNPIGNYAISQVGPNYPGPPVLTLGLLSPPYANSITAREDPTSFRYTPYHPFESTTSVKHYLTKVIPNNIQNALSFFWLYLLALFSLLSVYLFSTKSLKRLVLFLKDESLPIVIVLAGIYIGGYLLQHLDGGFRYVCPAFVLLLLAILRTIALLQTPLQLSRSTLLILALLLVPVSLLPYAESFDEARRVAHESRTIRGESVNLKNLNPSLPLNAKIASNDPYRAAYICYFLSLKCYGKPNTVNELREKDILYIIDFSDLPPTLLDTLDATTIFQREPLSIRKVQ